LLEVDDGPIAGEQRKEKERQETIGSVTDVKILSASGGMNRKPESEN
jgi:hypothetical protein